MGCLMSNMSEDFDVERKSKRQRLNPEEPVELSPAVADVIENYDLLREILLRVGSTDGLVLAERQKLSQVSKFWREICRSLPVRVAFSKPMTPEQEFDLEQGIPSLSHLEFCGPSENRVPYILDSQRFQDTCAKSLTSLCNLPCKRLSSIHNFPNLETLEICRCERTNVLDFLHGTCYDLAPLAGLSKLKNLTLKGIGDSMTSIINFQHLPSSLRHLRLQDTSFVHHPEFKVSENLKLDTLLVTVTKERDVVLPIELISHAKETSIEGMQVNLVGSPTVYPDMEDEMIEVLMEGPMMLLISFSVDRTHHNFCLSTILDDLTSGIFQSLHVIFSSPGEGDVRLVSRSDCRRGMRWKSLETVTEPDFIVDTIAMCEAEDLGLSAKSNVEHGELQSFRIWRRQSKGCLANREKKQQQTGNASKDGEALQQSSAPIQTR